MVGSIPTQGSIEENNSFIYYTINKVTIWEYHKTLKIYTHYHEYNKFEKWKYIRNKHTSKYCKSCKKLIPKDFKLYCLFYG